VLAPQNLAHPVDCLGGIHSFFQQLSDGTRIKTVQVLRKKRQIFTLDHLTGRRMISGTAVDCEQLTTNRTENFRQEITEAGLDTPSRKGMPMRNIGVIGPGPALKRITNRPSDNHS